MGGHKPKKISDEHRFAVMLRSLAGERAIEPGPPIGFA
jgi:hypothetical protein